MKLLFIGDIVGSPGRDAIRALLPQLKQQHAIDFVVANAENAAGGTGITPRIANDLFQSGCDVLTAGDHVWKRREILDIITDNARILRPLNMPSTAPGNGSGVYTLASGVAVAVVVLLGRVFIDAMTDSPFLVMRDAVNTLRQKTNIIILDFHAEATSEKVAMGWFLDGKISALLGTHTHIQTADERVLPKGTAYITDVGMTGPCDSVIGRNKEKVIERFLTGMPTRFELGVNDIQLHGALVDIDEANGKAKTITRIKQLYQPKSDP